MPAPALTSPGAPPGTRAPRRHRTEIEGLRALAVSLVVGYHVFSGRVSGGVDVFLALTGFFLVLGLTGQLARTGSVDPLRAIGRTLGRLVPAAALVLAGTVVAAAVVLPRSRWREIADHLLSSMTFTENLRLVDEAADYSASNALASPMQQFWSLSIQVQVLLATPFVVAAGALVVRRCGWQRHGRLIATVAVAVLTVASLVWSVRSTAAHQEVAYFSTLPRVWEIGLGALTALLLAGVRPGPRSAAVLGWAGVLALVSCGALLDGAQRFPGWQAAWPVLAAVAVVVAADHGGRWGPHRALSLPAARWLGARSYALYLWHWPVLVLYLAHTGRGTPTVLGAVLVIGSSLLLAAVSYRLVERPSAARLHAWRPTAALAAVAVCAAPLVTASWVATSWLDREAGRLAAVAEDPDYPGATVLRSPLMATAGPSGVDPLPSDSVIRDDWPWLPPEATCSTEVQDAEPAPVEVETCVLGSDDRPPRVAVVGDSHSAQWLPPVAAIAEEEGWQVFSIIRGGCNLSTSSEFFQEGDPEYDACLVWQSRLVERIVGLEPDLVLATGTRTDPGDGEEWVPDGYVEAWQQLSDAGLRVIGMRDTPRHLEDMPDCLAQWGDDSARCEVERASVYADGLLEGSAEVLPSGVTLFDTSDYFCDDSVCPALVGNVRVYMDRDHVTGTYMRTVTPLLAADLLPVIGW